MAVSETPVRRRRTWALAGAACLVGAMLAAAPGTAAVAAAATSAGSPCSAVTAGYGPTLYTLPNIVPGTGSDVSTPGWSPTFPPGGSTDGIPPIDYNSARPGETGAHEATTTRPGDTPADVASPGRNPSSLTTSPRSDGAAWGQWSESAPWWDAFPWPLPASAAQWGWNTASTPTHGVLMWKYNPARFGQLSFPGVPAGARAVCQEIGFGFGSKETTATTATLGIVSDNSVGTFAAEAQGTQVHWTWDGYGVAGTGAPMETGYGFPQDLSHWAVGFPYPLSTPSGPVEVYDYGSGCWYRTSGCSGTLGQNISARYMAAAKTFTAAEEAWLAGPVPLCNAQNCLFTPPGNTPADPGDDTQLSGDWPIGMTMALVTGYQWPKPTTTTTSTTTSSTVPTATTTTTTTPTATTSSTVPTGTTTTTTTSTSSTVPTGTTTTTTPGPASSTCTSTGGASGPGPWRLDASGSHAVIDNGSANDIVLQASYGTPTGGASLASSSLSPQSLRLYPQSDRGATDSGNPGGQTWRVLDAPMPYYGAVKFTNRLGSGTLPPPDSAVVDLRVNAPSPAGDPYVVAACGTVTYTLATSPGTPRTQAVAATWAVRGYGPALGG